MTSVMAASFLYPSSSLDRTGTPSIGGLDLTRSYRLDGVPAPPICGGTVRLNDSLRLICAHWIGYPESRKQPHRHYALDVKRRIVEETFAPGASVSITVAASVCRRRCRPPVLPESRKGTSLPESRSLGVIEIELPGGIKVRVDAGIDEAAELDAKGFEHTTDMVARATASAKVRPTC